VLKGAGKKQQRGAAGTAAAAATGTATAAMSATPLALDAAATMLEHKIRYHDLDLSCWNCLQNCIKSSCQIFKEKGEQIEKQLIKRCLSLVFQRLARSSEAWNLCMINFMENILTQIWNKNLCGAELYVESTDSYDLLSINTGISATNNVSNVNTNLSSTDADNISTENKLMNIGQNIDIDNDKVHDNSYVTASVFVSTNQHINMPDMHDSHKILKYVSQTLEEQQLLLFIVDVISCLRKASLKQSIYGREMTSLKLSMNIILSCLRICTEVAVDRIVNEVSFVLFNFNLF
jgi:hypothetical protein